LFGLLFETLSLALLLRELLLLLCDFKILSFLVQVVLQEVFAVLQAVVQVGHCLFGFDVNLVEALMHKLNLVPSSIGRQQQEMSLSLGLLMDCDYLLAKSLGLLQVRDRFSGLRHFTSLEIEYR